MREAFRQWTEEFDPELHPPTIFDPKEWGFIYEFHFREDNLFIGFVEMKYDREKRIAFGQYDPIGYLFIDEWCYKKMLDCDV